MIARRGASLVAGAVAAVLLVAACNPAPSRPASAAPVATAGTAPSPAASGLAGGGLSISSILGGNLTVPAATTWARVADPATPFSYEAPSTWTVHTANPWQSGGTTIGTALAAGPDLAKLSTDFSVPGVVVGVSANPSGMTPRQALAGDDFSYVCTATPVEDASDAGATIAYQLWRSCGGGAGVLLVLVIAPADGGLLGIVFQGTSEADLGYLDHIVRSLAAAVVTATAPPAPSTPSGGGVSGPTYAISMDVCQNQHGQGVSGGLIQNTDSLIHSYRIVVAFSDPNGVFLNDTGWTNSDLQPGVTARWQATVPSGLPAVSVSCQITRVELIR